MKLHPRTSPSLCVDIIVVPVIYQAEDTWEPEDSLVDTVNGVRTVTKELQTYLAASCQESQTPLRTPSADRSSTEEPLEHQIGRRLDVFWALDDCYYSGQVVSYKADSNTHVIQYDDGQQETLDLSEEKWRWSSCNTSSSSSSSSSSSLALSNGVTHDRKEQQANAQWARSQKAMAVRRPERLGSKNGRGHACAVCAKIFSQKSVDYTHANAYGRQALCMCGM